MLIAGELRKSNIAEYLLYMWQVEDLIRANGFDPDRLTAVAAPGVTDAETLKSVRQWYAELADMMVQEGVREKGHLQICNNVMILLSDLHARILDSNGCSEYKHAYFSALPVIVGYRAKSDSTDRSELESCFEFMYGIWMLKLQGKTLSDGTADAAQRISAFLARLAAYYLSEQNGDLDLEHEK